MKKIITLIAVMALALCACFAVACSSPAGTYKFKSMSMSGMGITINYEAGKEYMGVTLSEDMMILELKEDGNCTLTSSLFGEEEFEAGTWEEVDGNVVITFDGEAKTFVKDGDTLSIVEEEDGMNTSIVLTK